MTEKRTKIAFDEYPTGKYYHSPLWWRQAASELSSSAAYVRHLPDQHLLIFSPPQKSFIFIEWNEHHEVTRITSATEMRETHLVTEDFAIEVLRRMFEE